MDHADHDRGRVALDALQSRVRELPRKFANGLRLAVPKGSYVRKLKAAVFILLALFFGTMGYRLNREELELQWRKTHVPTPAIWNGSFASAGFHPLSNPSWVAKITRYLPSSADLKGQIWSAKPDWWAIDTGDGSAPLVFCSRCNLQPPPRDWAAAGSGWDGWESAIRTAKEEEIALKPRVFPKKRTVAFDPREIRY